ncbi:MAG: hypothetical protein K2N50_03765 [Clostridia bacterium]|nr:hypothetical protein [Clostridia bacterium]
MAENVLTDELNETDSSGSAQAKEKKKNKTRKVVATTTYFIAMLCLLAGLFVPLFYCVEGVAMPERMMFRYLPSMLNGIVGKEFIKLKEGSYFLTYYGYTPGKFNFMSLIGVLYAVVCVISVLMFIPILLGSKKKNTSANCALGVEVLAMLVTLSYIAYNTFFLVNEHIVAWTDYNFLIALGGVLLMAIVQTVASKGGIGVSKVIGLILSVIGVIALMDITLFIPKLADPLGKLSTTVKSGDVAAFLNGTEGGTYLGVHGINFLIMLKETIEMFKDLAGQGSKGILSLIVLILLIVVAVFTVLNLLFDTIGLSTGKKFKKDRTPCANRGSNTFALVRYIVTFLFAVTIIVFTFTIKDLGMKTGIYLWLLVIVLLISIINAAVRTACDNARVKKGAIAPVEDTTQGFTIADPSFNSDGGKTVVNEYVYPVAQPVINEAPAPVVPETTYTAEPEYVSPDYMPEGYTAQPIPVDEPLSAPLEVEPEPAEPTPTVYIYGGATDEFMETLNDNEKVEFVELFIKKSKGKVNGVPDYEIGADNSDFFPAVFVHINRYRNIVSDALMTKMYKQLGKV